MDLKIKDLVTVNQNAVLDTGVQLAWYYEPERNERYATGYLFSHGEFSGDKTSAIRIFESIRDSLLDASQQNIFTIIAGYGQGKTHYALVLANYFGRPPGDPLVAQIIEQIGRCSTQQIAEHFQYFKQNVKKPQLVVKLAGHDYDDLRRNFLQALRKALDEYEDTKDYAIPSTSREAANWLRSLSDEQREHAVAFLEEENEVELEELIGELEGFNARYETLAREISKKLNGVYADFGATADLKELITQIIDGICTGENAPFNKMVILFDELGVYLDEWRHDPIRAGNIALQSILEACRNREGKVCFVSFLQRDPDQYANFAQPDEEGVTRFTTRLKTRFTLAANLELVLKSLLQKPDIQQWESFMRVHIRRLESASQNAMAALPQYSEDKWVADDFLKVVVKGTFPLHPLTTGLLCHLDFAQGRSVMGFVDDEIKLINEQPAKTTTGNPNWILPVRIVDSFRENFRRHEGLAPGKAGYADYENAVHQLGTNADEKFYTVLKALFLYYVGNIKKFPSQSHASVLAQLAGINSDTVDEALKRLEIDFDMVIRYVPARGEYEFSGVGTSAGNILPILRKEIAGQRVPSLANSLNELKILDVMDDEGVLPDTEASTFKEQYVVEGKEWKLQPILVDAADIKQENMQRLINELEKNDKVRGLLVYALPSEVSQWGNAKQDAVKTLNVLEQEGYPYPIAIALTRSAEGLHELLLMLHELNNWGASKKKLYGRGYEDAVEHIERKLHDQFAQLIKETSYIVCDKLKASFRSEETKPDQIASHLFHHAYPYRPPACSSVMVTSSNNGQRYTAAIGRFLITNSLSNEAFQNLEKAQQNLVTDVLVEGADKWGVLDENYRLNDEPSHSKVKQAWQTLDETIPTKERPIPFERLIKQFKGMPYGYDDLALTFLFTVWIGVHQHELSFMGDPNPRRKQVQPSLLTLSALQGQLANARKFIQWLEEGKVTVSRSDIGKLKQTVADCVEKMKVVDDYKAALELLVEAEKYKEKLPEEDEQLQELIQLEEELREDIAEVEKYLEYVREKQKIIERTSQLSVLLSTEREISEHHLPEVLTFDNSILTETKERCQGRVEEFVTRLEEEQLTQLEQYERLKGDLRENQSVLEEYGLIDKQQRIATALERLEADYSSLKAQEEEKVAIEKIRAIRLDDSTGLATCRQQLETAKRILSEDLKNASNEVIGEAQAKIDELQLRIDADVKWLSDLSYEIGDVSIDRKRAQALHQDVISREKLYAGTSEAEELQAYKTRLEKIEEHFQSEAKKKAERNVAVQSYLGEAKANLTGMNRVQDFEQSVPFHIGLMELKSPEGIELTESERAQFQSVREGTFELLRKRYEQLLTKDTPKDERGFERQKEALERALAAVSEKSHLSQDWHSELQNALEKLEEQFHHWRQEQEKIQREARNQQRVSEAVKHAKLARRWIEIPEALSAIGQTKNELESPSNELLGRLEQVESQLLQKQAELQEWVKKLPEALKQATTLSAIESLRGTLNNREGDYAGDEQLSSILSDARSTLSQRRDFLRELDRLEKQADSVENCLTALNQIGQLQPIPDGFEEIVNDVCNRINALHSQFEEERRQSIEAWLEQFAPALEGEFDIELAKKFQRILNNKRPSGLTEEDNATIAMVQAAISATFDKHQLEKVIMEFEQLSSAESKAECLSRMITLSYEQLSPNAIAQLHTMLEREILEQEVN